MGGSVRILSTASTAAHATAARTHALATRVGHICWRHHASFARVFLHLLLLAQAFLFFRHGAAAGLLAWLLLNLPLFTDLFGFGECGRRESNQAKAGHTSLTKVFPIHDVDPMEYGS
jgi:hypothetical protein